jgi:hypothetical protein
MALTVQNLRAVGTGVEPASLLPGQICFNITDKILYVGDGSNFKTSFNGTQVAGVPGEGWYAMPMDFTILTDYYVANPEVYGDVPTDQQVLTWSTALNHPIWTSGGAAGGNQVYVITNTQVASAPGSTTSEKITAAIGVASPDEGDVTIVTGLPDDVYEGLYFFTIEWVKGAAYAYPSASEVIYDNSAHSSLAATVQGAIDNLDDGLIATTAIANTPNSTATSALSIATAALPKAGGTMTGTIISQNINVPTGYGVQFNGGIAGTIQGITDSTSTTSSNLAASATGLKTSYDLAIAALPRTGGTMTGAITFAAGQVFPVSGIQDATAAQKGIVQIGTNIQVAAGVISIPDATTTGKGVVQLNDTLNSTLTTQALTARAGASLQSQIDSLTLASNVTLAGSLDASTGLLDSVTTAGAGAGFAAGSVLPAAAAGNADYYVLVTVGGSYSPPGGGGPYNAQNGDWILSDGSTWQYLGVGSRPQSASYTTAGIVQLADTAVTYTGTSDTEAVTPNSLQDKITDSVATTDSNLIASATAVKTAYDVGAAAIPCSTITAVGDIVIGGAGPAPTALPVGTNGQVLIANSACSTGLEWGNACYVPDACFAAAGDIIVGTGAGTYSALSAGPANYILSSDGAGALQWVQQSEGDVTGVTGTAPITVDNTDPQNPIVGINSATTTSEGAVQLYDGVDSTSTTLAATANAAKIAYDEAVAAATYGIASATVIFVNCTAGSDTTGQRGTNKAFLTINAALAAASNGDTIYLSPGSFTENVTLTKGVNLVGTYNEQGMAEGTSIVGNFVYDMVSPAATVNPTINHIRFISPNTSNAFSVINNSFGSGGIGTINDCAFVQAGDTSITEFCFETSGTWSRSLYMRRSTFDGNVKHAAGTAAGANGYLVLDDILATGSPTRHYKVETGTIDFRRASNAISPVLHTGGTIIFTDLASGISPSNSTTSPLFGGTNICYSGSAASLGTGLVYFNGYSVITGAIIIGANMIYGWSQLATTAAGLIVDGSAVAYPAAVPAAAASLTVSQSRPRYDLLTTASTVAAADQLATVVDATTGTLYSVTTLDAGTY